MLVSYYLPGNSSAQPPGHRAYGGTAHTEAAQAIWGICPPPIPYGWCPGGCAWWMVIFSHPSRMGGGSPAPVPHYQSTKVGHNLWWLVYVWIDIICNTILILITCLSIKNVHFRHLPALTLYKLWADIYMCKSFITTGKCTTIFWPFQSFITCCRRGIIL